MLTSQAKITFRYENFQHLSAKIHEQLFIYKKRRDPFTLEFSRLGFVHFHLFSMNSIIVTSVEVNTQQAEHRSRRDGQQQHILVLTN